MEGWEAGGAVGCHVSITRTRRSVDLVITERFGLDLLNTQAHVRASSVHMQLATCSVDKTHLSHQRIYATLGTFNKLMKHTGGAL